MQLANKTKEFEEMRQKLEAIIKQQNSEINKLKEENQKLLKNKEIEIFDTDAIHEYDTLEKIGTDGQIAKVCMKKVYALNKNIIY